MNEETRGGMNIRMQQETWSAFVRLVKWSVGISIAILVLMWIFLLG